LAFARKQNIAPRVLDINDTVSGMLKMIRRLIGEDINLIWMPGANLWPVLIDPAQLDQIIANLCVNARDAIKGVGKITIMTENIMFDNAVHTYSTDFRAGEYVKLSVIDDGCGMEKDVKEHLFEPFFTTKEIGKGTGLGLATVYGIVRQNNGFIDVYSEPGMGSTFKIYLPRFYGKNIKDSDVKKEGVIQKGSETILLVEDEHDMMNMIKIMLERLGYMVLAAGTPGDALKIAENYSGKIHMLITDIVMPEMNGTDLAKKILSVYGNIKCLFMSGYTASVLTHPTIIEEGMIFIEKPFTTRELAGKIRKAMEQDRRH
ncbi:MAG: ATP-binding protein, partial [Candidatus Eremiobacterota bacterium]